MNQGLYIGTARLPDGSVLATVTGTIAECANWADNIILAHSGGICITISEVPE